MRPSPSWLTGTTGLRTDHHITHSYVTPLLTLSPCNHNEIHYMSDQIKLMTNHNLRQSDNYLAILKRHSALPACRQEKGETNSSIDGSLMMYFKVFPSSTLFFWSCQFTTVAKDSGTLGRCFGANIG